MISSASAKSRVMFSFGIGGVELDFCGSLGWRREGDAENEEPLLILNGSTSSSCETGFCFACGKTEAPANDKIKNNEKTLLIVRKRPQKAFKQARQKINR